MKKAILFGIAVLACVLTIAGCDTEDSVTTDYDKLNELADKEYSSITLNVSTAVNGVTLAGEYVSTATDDGYQITYTYDQMAVFGEDEGDIVIPDSYKQTLSGTAVISNGVVTSQSGDEVDLTIGQLTASGLSFDSKNFNEANTASGKFTAKVTEIDAFLGQSVSASDMTVAVSYSETALSSLTIEYRSKNGAAVTMTYIFN